VAVVARLLRVLLAQQRRLLWKRMEYRPRRRLLHLVRLLRVLLFLRLRRFRQAKRLLLLRLR
jgi:hypothetical protein